MRENFVLLLFDFFLVLMIFGLSHAEVIEVVAPPLRVSPTNSEDLELCYSVRIPDGNYIVPFFRQSLF